MINFAARYTPGASIWYGRLALERMVFDQLKLWADPDAAKKDQTLAKKVQKRIRTEILVGTR